MTENEIDLKGYEEIILKYNCEIYISFDMKLFWSKISYKTLIQ